MSTLYNGTTLLPLAETEVCPLVKFKGKIKNINKWFDKSCSISLNAHVQSTFEK